MALRDVDRRGRALEGIAPIRSRRRGFIGEIGHELVLMDQEGYFSPDTAWCILPEQKQATSMNAQQQLEELEKLAATLDVDVRYEPMAGLVQGTGGLCRLKGRWCVIMDRRLRAAERVQILAEALARFDTEAHFLSPQLRQLLAS